MEFIGRGDLIEEVEEEDRRRLMMTATTRLGQLLSISQDEIRSALFSVPRLGRVLCAVYRTSATLK